ncbi:hypothetical protein JCM10212_002195 [Sporobolomyces blumeae]
MLFSKKFVLSLLPLLVAARPASEKQSQRPLDSFISSETPISFTETFKNIGSAAGAKPGIIIASPSTVDPDYLYTWTRDAALTAHGLLEVSDKGNLKKTLAFMPDYVSAQDILQHVANPSGTFSDLSGLAEPKFNINETAFTGPWGRPQRDGPALRARALMKYVELYSSKIPSSVKKQLDTVILNDLDYTVKYWNTTGFDLWEEVNGSSFFTTLSQFHALAHGSNYFKSSNSSRASNYFSTAEKVRCFADSYWTPKIDGKHDSYISNFNLVYPNNRVGLDANSIIAAQLYPSAPSPAYTSDPCSAAFFSPCSDRMLASLLAVVESFRGVYEVNAARESAGAKAIAIGRYKEDVYYNGNPWYLTTLAPAEQLYRAVSIWNGAGSLEITETSLPFFQNLMSSAAVGTYKKGDGKYEKIISAVSSYADDFVAIVQQYTPPGGALSEQYSRQNGTQLSARDLTWSYVAFLTATHFRSLQDSRTAPDASKPLFGSTNLTCAAGSAGGAPNGTVPVNFKVTKVTVYGENVFLSGSAAALGEWDVTKAIPLNANSYTASAPIWQTGYAVNLPANATLSYKYVLQSTNGSFSYENGNNRTFTTPASGSTSLADIWQE